jgi:NodT family efflux transporter outer membrane factor (OMF) lipoprotein
MHMNPSNLFLKSPLLLLMAGVLSLSGCALGPDYVRPATPTPTAFKEGANSDANAQDQASRKTATAVAATGPAWRLAQPNDTAARGKWWEVFGDPQLNALQEQVVISNQNIAQYVALFNQARAQLDSATAAEYPNLSLSASERRSGPSSSANNALLGTTTNTTGTTGTTGTTSTTRSGKSYSAALGASWEIDLWGSLRRNAESKEASALASDADLANALLSAQTDLANNYFKLRLIDSQKELLRQTLEAYQKSIDLTRNRYAGGVAARADVVQAETQYKSTLVQAIDLDVQRTQYEHAIALDLGKPASDFKIDPAPLNVDKPNLPNIPSAGLPSELLERRPDIAGAERRMIAANASIGVAKAAFFPSLSLSASDGYTSSSLANWISAPNRIWSFGPALALSVFDAGAQRAALRQAQAGYDASVATYRQTVLNGFKEVEDYLAQMRIYELEADAQYDALQSAREALALTINQYKAGTVSYLNVISAQATAFSAERNVATLLGDRINASILLIKALGGGWNTTELNLAAR